MSKMCVRLLSVGGLVFATAALGADPGPSYSPWADTDYPRQVYWGDTHLHTSYSLDANLFGLTSLTPEDAYRFARGETITAGNGMRARLNRPLDFLVAADHAEYIGVMRLVRADKLPGNKTAERWRRALADKGNLTNFLLDIAASYETGRPAIEIPPDVVSPWTEVARMADAANDPGKFTALIGFEWTAMPDGDNLHRVVVFRDDASKTSQVPVFSTLDSVAVEDLWQYMADYVEKTGGDVLAIPHNGNLSGGLMFASTDSEGRPISGAYARRRSKWEPLIEVTQIKGDGEAHPLLSPNDEFADYETWDTFNIDMSKPQEPWMFHYEYARPALKLGLQLAAQTGANPYAFGMIGSTDSHTALSAVEEDNFWGKTYSDFPNTERASEAWGIPAAGIPNWAQVAAGYAGVWATENTREAIFDAMQRREVYASTGPRMTVRLFGGWHFTHQDLWSTHPALAGYQKGVPMGGDLPERPAQAAAPSFMVWALKDAEGANLDRIQIVKGWLDSAGQTREKVYDVAWSDERRENAAGRLPPVGSTVDLETATYRNTIGAAQLQTVWNDPDFDPARRAFYYVRVLQIPTPRWTAYDRVKLGARLPEGTPQIHQERAYTSPVWYTPPTAKGDR